MNPLEVLAWVGVGFAGVVALGLAQLIAVGVILGVKEVKGK